MKLSACIMALAALAVVCDARELKTRKTESECLNELTYDECFSYHYDYSKMNNGHCELLWRYCKDHKFPLYSDACEGIDGIERLEEYMSACMKSPPSPRYSEKDVETCLKRTNADENRCSEYWRESAFDDWTIRPCTCRSRWITCHDKWITGERCYTDKNGAFREEMYRCLNSPSPPPPPPRPPRPPTPDKEAKCLLEVANKYLNFKQCARIDEYSNPILVHCSEIWPICDTCDWSDREKLMCDWQDPIDVNGGAQMTPLNNGFLRDMYDCLKRQRCDMKES